MKTYLYLAVERAQFHRATALAGVAADLSARLNQLYDQAAAEIEAQESRRQTASQGNTNWRESLLPELRAGGGPVARVSRFLRQTTRMAEEPEGRSELTELGARFDWNEIAREAFYVRNWQREARDLDLDGPIGQMAVIGLSTRGFCGTGFTSDAFRQVIREGNALLAKGLDASTAAQVHFMVGDAYSDMVAIAGGNFGPNGEYNLQEFRDQAAANTPRRWHTIAPGRQSTRHPRSRSMRGGRPPVCFRM